MRVARSGIDWGVAGRNSQAGSQKSCFVLDFYDFLSILTSFDLGLGPQFTFQHSLIMARRASSHLHPGIILGAVAVIAGGIFAGKSVLGKKSATFGDVSVLAIGELLDNGNSLRGNEYLVKGQIDEKLQWTTDRGQLVSVRIDTPRGDEFIGIEIPAEFSKLNIDTKQKYAFRVKFRQGGIAVATGVTRL